MNAATPAEHKALASYFLAMQLSPQELKRQVRMTRLELFLKIHKLLWPEDIQHRWFVLGLKSLVENKVSVLLGSANSGKTYLMAVHALIVFFAHSRNSLALISSTEKRSLELKVWGRVKQQYNRAKTRFDWLPGYVLDSAMAITPDETDDENILARELNKGIVCVPCIASGRFVGMGKFQGAKPPNSPGKLDGILSHYGDEAAVMQSSFLDAYTNWLSNAGFRGCMAGNPTDISDPLCTAAEPVGGWDSFVDNGKTQEWTSRWYGAHCIAFDGRDSPNNENHNRFPFLITKEWLAELEKTHGADSWQLYQQGIGKPSRGMVSNRVITMGLCERHRAFEPAVWKDGKRTKLYSLDPAYGGGDRCVGGMMEFGETVDGTVVLELHQPEIVPIRLNAALEPEEQIAGFIRDRLKQLDIPAKNCGYDSFGRGTLGFAFSKVFGSESPVPIDSGMKPTDRPVRHDLFVSDGEVRRLKRCAEHYSKFVTEMWFSTREAIESEQIRGLTTETAREGQSRLYQIVAGNRIEVESKDDMKERIKASPDLYDWFALGCEMARRLGFQIKRIGNAPKEKKKTDWLDEQIKDRRELLESNQLAIL